MLKLVRITIFLYYLLVTSSLFAATTARTYYIDCANGSDNNSGTSESAPWAHAPGMTGTVNGVGPGTIDTYNGNGGMSCGNATCSLPGYQFIFKGGVTCGAGSGAGGGFPWIMRMMGTGSVIGTSALYIGVDQTWYAGEAWTRPIMNAGGAAAGLCGTASSQVNSAGCFGGLSFFKTSPTGYFIFDNFEWTGLYWNATGVTNGQETYINVGGCGQGSAIGHCIVENMYMHGWAHAAYGGTNADVCNLISSDSVDDKTSIAENNVIDGSDTAKDACVAFWFGPAIGYSNYVHGVPNGAVVDSAVSWHDNWWDTITSSYDPTQHQNTFEDNGASNNEFFYNNLVTNTTNSNGLTLNFAPCTGTTTYVFNNIIANVDDTPLNVQPECGAGTFFVFNNSIELGADSVKGSGNGGIGTGTYPGCPSGLSGCTYTNNHFIGTNNQSTQICQAPCTDTTNLSQTIAVAKANVSPAFNQYSFAQSPYVFPPVVNTNSTVGAGTNSSSSCTTITNANAAAGDACVNDTTYGVGYNSSTHTVITPPPYRNPNGRPGSGAWDIGAYFYTTGENQPNPPTGLTAIVN
jgi:hypothetical protein